MEEDTISLEDAVARWDQPLYVAYHRTDKREPVTTAMISHALNCNYDMLTCTVTNEHFHSRVLAQLAAYSSRHQGSQIVIPPLSHLDTDLSPGEVAHRVVAFASTWIDICSRDTLISELSRQVLALEMAYAAFCGVEYLVVPGPRVFGEASSLRALTSYARAIQEALTTGPHLNILLRFSLTHDAGTEDSEELEIGHLSNHARPASSKNEKPANSNGFKIWHNPPKHDSFGSWDCWHTVRSICNYNPRLLIALSIPEVKVLGEHHGAFVARVAEKWYCEPVKALLFRPNSFIKTSKERNLDLPSDIQSLFSRLLRVKLGPWVILEDVEELPSPEITHWNDNGQIQVDGFKNKVFEYVVNPTPAETSLSMPKLGAGRDWPFIHLEYIRALQDAQEPKTVVERYGSGYQDYLQIPLQPLSDNLESMTYEVFEKDPVKYELYEEAVRKALRDWHDQKQPVSGKDGRVVVVVAGAGRGPLVTRAIRASEMEQVPIEIWAVEKNPNAYVHLQKNNTTVWSGKVTIERSDMRSWKGPWRDQDSTGTIATKSETSQKKQYYPVDILISELLGSFGDNELSPECLDGILHLLSPQGISIPRSYTAFLTPIAAPKLHADLLARLAWDTSALETPAVVWLHAIEYLSILENPSGSRVPEILEAWTFKHESSTDKSIPKENNHNARFTKLDFAIPNRSVCHGFGGYFESVLYPGVELSTHPNTMEQKSAAMISWFPIFFPLKTPIYVPDLSLLSITMWRQTDSRKVWYEWLVESWMHGDGIQELQNLTPIRLGVSDLHSSIKNGCLMITMHLLFDEADEEYQVAAILQLYAKEIVLES